MNISEIYLEIQNSKRQVHSLIIEKSGELIAEKYFNGFEKNQLQKLYSCTKSISSLMVGIALDLNPKYHLDSLISEIAPELIGENERAKVLTLRHFLNQTTGFRWMETGRPFAAGHSGFDMEQSENWIEFLFNQEMSSEPGSRFAYNTGVSHLLPYLASKMAGISQVELFENYLQKPLGLGDYEWDRDPQNNLTGGKGLALKPKALLKLGQLILNKGVFENQRIVSESYLKEATSAQSRGHVYYGTYGLQWWLKNWPEGPTVAENEHNIICAIGFGGQFLLIVPEWELIAVFTGKLIGPENFEYPQKLFREMILSALN